MEGVTDGFPSALRGRLQIRDRQRVQGDAPRTAGTRRIEGRSRRLHRDDQNICKTSLRVLEGEEARWLRSCRTNRGMTTWQCSVYFPNKRYVETVEKVARNFSVPSFFSYCNQVNIPVYDFFLSIFFRTYLDHGLDRGSTTVLQPRDAVPLVKETKGGWSLTAQSYLNRVILEGF